VEGYYPARARGQAWDEKDVLRADRRRQTGSARSRLLPHPAFGARQRFRERRPREEALRIFHERRRLFRHHDTVIVEAPKKRRDRDVEHRVLLTQHVLVLGEHRSDLQEAVADEVARLLDLLLVVAFERVDVDEELLLE